ncbi:protein-L-isoaspartate O-methyltransferase family protein (plasmid) [Glutamicibacter sp. FR1]|uniref:protein-L-isoaspartate O-methyltransferase family protein n=1 Tax=Glutamicibacter sp. FR1 TaxID=3393744 RepID=UPI0039AF0B48
MNLINVDSNDAVHLAMDKVHRSDFLCLTADPSEAGGSTEPDVSSFVVSDKDVVAETLRLSNLAPGMSILEIGTGSGYSTALTYELVRPTGRVHSIEYDSQLATTASEKLNQRYADPQHLTIRTGDAFGSIDLPDHSVDRVIVTVATPAIGPDWLRVLKPDGQIICPLDLANHHKLVRLRRINSVTLKSSECIDCRFVPVSGIMENSRSINAMSKGTYFYSHSSPPESLLMQIKASGWRVAASMEPLSPTEYRAFRFYCNLVDPSVFGLLVEERFEPKRNSEGTSPGFRLELVGHDDAGIMLMRRNGSVLVVGNGDNLASTLQAYYAQWRDLGSPYQTDVAVVASLDATAHWTFNVEPSFPKDRP